MQAHLRRFLGQPARRLGQGDPVARDPPAPAAQQLEGQERLRHRAGDRRHGPHVQAHPRRGRAGQLGQRLHRGSPSACARRAWKCMASASARRSRPSATPATAFIYVENLSGGRAGGEEEPATAPAGTAAQKKDASGQGPEDHRRRDRGARRRRLGEPGERRAAHPGRPSRLRSAQLRLCEPEHPGREIRRGSTSARNGAPSMSAARLTRERDRAAGKGSAA